MEHQVVHQKKSFFRALYEDHYKKLMIIPILLFVFAIVQIGYQISTTGDFVNKGVSLKGGLTVTIPSEKTSLESIQSLLTNEFPNADLSARLLSGAVENIVVEAAGVEAEQMIDALAKANLQREEYTIEQTGPALGSSFFRAAISATLIAFVLMSVVVFLFFKTFVPSTAVIVCAMCDILETLAIFNLTGAKLTTAGVAAFLMLIGYSVDTDMLLTTRVLKRREGTVMSRIYSAIGTGLTMTMTTIAAVVVALIFINSEVIRQIMTIILIGLLLDIVNTWIQNVGIVRMYIEHKEKRGQRWQ
jgi:preprotein translocase subunit SecF